MTGRAFAATLVLELKYIAKAWRWWLAVVPVLLVGYQVLGYDAKVFVPYRYAGVHLLLLSLLAIGVFGAMSSRTRVGELAMSRPTSPRWVLSARLSAYGIAIIVVWLLFLALASTIGGAFTSLRSSSRWDEIAWAATSDSSLEFTTRESEACFRAAEAELPGAAIDCGETLHTYPARLAASEVPLIRGGGRGCLEGWRRSSPECMKTRTTFDSTDSDAIQFLELDEALRCRAEGLHEPDRCRKLASRLGNSTERIAYVAHGRRADRCMRLLIWLRSKPAACASPYLNATARPFAPAWFVSLMLAGTLLAIVCFALVNQPRSAARGWMQGLGFVYVLWLWFLLPGALLLSSVRPWMVVASPFVFAASCLAIGLLGWNRVEFVGSDETRSTWRRPGWSFGFWILFWVFVVSLALALVLVLTISRSGLAD